MSLAPFLVWSHSSNSLSAAHTNPRHSLLHSQQPFVVVLAEMHKSIRLQTRRPTTSARVLFFLVEVFRPILLLIGFVLRLIYQVLCSWWLNPAFDGWIRNRFALEIKEAIPTLFDLHGGRVISDPKPQTNDSNMDYLCLASGSLIFKFCRWRRENYEVQVAATFAPTEFFNLLDAVHLVDPAANTKLAMLDGSWRIWGQLLEPRFHLLEQAFNADHFLETKARLASHPSV